LGQIRITEHWNMALSAGAY